MTASTFQRDEQIRLMRGEGQTLQEIADAVGVTRERVRQILRRIGGPTAAEVREGAAQRHRDLQDDIAARVREDLSTHPGSTADEVAARLGCSKRDVQQHVPEDLRARIVNPAATVEQVWSDEDIMQALRTVGTYAFPVASADYDALLRTGEVQGPSVARICQRFGNWGNACRLAGVEPPPPRRDHYQSKWTDEDILAFVQDYLAAPGSSGTFSDYDPWRREHAPSAPSSALLRQRLGPWTQVKRKALGS